MGGTFYSIAEFMDWLIKQINDWLKNLPTPYQVALLYTLPAEPHTLVVLFCLFRNAI